jgi:hypothetical protein
MGNKAIVATVTSVFIVGLIIALIGEAITIDEITFRDIARFIAFIVFFSYLAISLRPKPWKSEPQWRGWLINTALVLIILVAIITMTPKYEVIGSDFY